ncbi:MAG: hypothetical protein HY270_01555 [Deltaproteobacteria bacterium]|nr:hypothetical protein [Deltaproteobacteria bacterium]
MKTVSALVGMILIAISVLPATGLAQPHSGDGRPPGLPPGPPPPAVDACNQQAEGNSCEFVGRYGEQVTGTCVVFPQRLACLPDNAPPPPPDDEQGR